MCAIIGSIGKSIDKKRFEESRDVMMHRGPDDSGVYYDKKSNVAFGHRRLSIIDLSEDGNQPFYSDDKRFVLVFNGEIYNYIELKKELEGDYNFKTKTDTEVLLAAYIKWGIECLDRLNGMFSFAIWDSKDKKLVAARDRLGIKPFYYSQNDGVLLFASEIKALLSLGVCPKEDERSIFEYLYYGYYDHSEKTFFKEIKQLRPGHLLIWKDKKIQISKYWDLAEVKDEWDYSDRQKIIRTFKELLTDSIRLRFRSDVPVGINLSSGIDSNSLLHFARIIIGEAPHSFSMCLPSEEYDECSLIDVFLNDEYKKKWNKTIVKPLSIIERAKLMDEIQDEPYGGIPTISYYSLHKLAQDMNVTVLLEGQGVDEILGGYAYYKKELEKDITNTPIDEQFINGLSQDNTKEVHRDILDDKFTQLYKKTPLDFPRPFKSHLLNAQYRDLMYTKLPRVLRFNDRVSMALGRELRLPYLDHRLVSFCFHLPKEYKINNDNQKVLIKEAMKDIIPHVFKNKPKKAFGAIQTEWFKSELKKEVYDFVNSKSAIKDRYFNHGALKKKVDEFYDGKIDNSFFIWQFINLDIWLSGLTK